MESSLDKQAQSRSAWQEHVGFRRQCVYFRQESAQLRAAIRYYREQLTALKQQGDQQHQTSGKIPIEIEFAQQELRNMELTLYELHFRFIDLVAKFHLLQKEEI